MCSSKQNEEKKSLEVKLSQNLIDKLKSNHSNISLFIENLIREKFEEENKREDQKRKNPSPDPEKEIERTTLEFMKKYRDDEWIDYVIETRGEKAILEEAERLKAKHHKKWSDFKNSE